MKTIVKWLKALYVALGGKLTDTYTGIALGAPVSEYARTPDCLGAIVQLLKTAAKLPAATAADAGKAVVVGETGDYELGEAGGGASGVLVVNMGDGSALNKTWAEIRNAMLTGIVVLNNVTDAGLETAMFRAAGSGAGNYAVYVNIGTTEVTFVTDNENGYPVLMN